MTKTAPFRRTMKVVWDDGGDYAHVEVWEKLSRDKQPWRVVNHRCRDWDVARIVQSTAARYRVHRDAIDFPQKPETKDGAKKADKN